MQAEDWILYSMTHQAELARVRCGGWRRQYTHIVTSPSRFTFACYRHRDIHIVRRCINASSDSSSRGFPFTIGWLDFVELVLQTGNSELRIMPDPELHRTSCRLT